MREILFRGKRLGDGKWVEGDLLRFQNATVIHGYVEGCRVADNVDPATVGQYTGLTANGKRIFEGDIIISGYTVAKVVFEKCQWREVDRLGYWSELFDDDVEIIGNIHDNPQLLEGGEGK